MDKSSYHSDYSRVSKTMLSHFMDSREDYARYYVDCTESPPEPTSRMVIGSAIHAAALEKFDLEKVCAVYPDECFKKPVEKQHLNPKPATAFREANAGKYVVKPKEMDVIVAAVASICRHPMGRLLERDDVQCEDILTWTNEFGLKCRCMLDVWADMGDKIVVYDLKTTEDILPNAVARVAKSKRYWLQQVHYSEGVRAFAGIDKPIEWTFWFLEAHPPFRLSPKRYTEDSMETAYRIYRQTMQDLAHCYDKGVFLDEWTQRVTHLHLGPWDAGVPETELTGFDEDDSDE